jgi:O-antigen ligase
MNPRFAPLLWAGALLCALFGGYLFWITQPTPLDFEDAAIAMDAPIFTYSPGWQVGSDGADPGEPADPWGTPSGVVTFTITSANLFLRLGVGDYWGYLYATVDGQPANALAHLPGNTNSLGQPAGYRTLYAPERQTPAGPGELWTPVYRGLDPRRAHTVRIEIWRGWGQTPLRGIATMNLSSHPLAPWTGVAYLVAAGWIAAGAWLLQTRRSGQRDADDVASVQPADETIAEQPVLLAMALVGMVAIAIGTNWQVWFLTLVGLALLGLASLVRPALWFAALYFALPFYFQYTLPLLPWRSFSLTEIGVLGGVGLLVVGWLRRARWVSEIEQRLFGLQSPAAATLHPTFRTPHSLILAAMASWALIAAVAADQQDVAMREWRVVFLAAALVGLCLPLLIRPTPPDSNKRQPGWALANDQTLLLVAWLGGATLVAVVALRQYWGGVNLITAEGVWRVRAFYGSPNNLALYLERTLAVCLALALFGRMGRERLAWAGVAAIQGAALLLTFSKGALLLGLPAMLGVLWLGGWVILGRQGRSRRLLWLVAALGALALLAMTPFLATERFQRLLDFRQGTGFLRLNLWRSAWQMALDHPLMGVGPDNFLYAYRSHYLLPAAWQEPNLNHPHNWVLDWWTRFGLPGLALALLWFGWLARRLWRGVRFGAQPVLSLGLLTAVAVGLAHGLIDASYALPDLMLVWVLIGWLAGALEQS